MKALFGNLLVLAVVLGQAHGQAAPQGGIVDRFVKERVVVPLNLPNGRIFNLRLPRFLPAPFEAGGFRRSYDDTCGLYDIVHSKNQSAGWGPQPHVHYSDDEWFVFAGTGQTRMFTGQQPTSFVAGQVPGYNAPAVEVGSAVLGPGDVLYSPRGNVHYYVRETEVTDAFDIHTSGYSAPLVIAASINITDPTELLYYTGLYGVPTDATGKMVGLEDYRSARGPVARGDPELVRLQALFDAGEECYPES